jgi:hypothetical protein
MGMGRSRPKERLTAFSGQFWVWAKMGSAGELAGTVIHQHDRCRYPFHSTLALIRTVNDCLDRIGAAEVGFRPRRWDREKEMEADRVKARGIPTAPKGGPTFVIRVERRQNATWQGEVQWLDGQRQQRFRSVLELIYLLEDVISQAPIPADDIVDWSTSQPSADE